MSGFEAWLFGYAGTKVTDKILSIFRQNLLIDNLHSAIEKWANDLPEDASLAVSYALFPSQLPYDDLEKHKALSVLRYQLSNCTIPTMKEWQNALMEQWQFVKDNINSPQDFFTIEKSEAHLHTQRLAEALDVICMKDRELFQASAIRLLRDLTSDNRNGLETENFAHVIHNIMLDIRNREFVSAERKLDTLMNIESLSSDTRNIFSALTIKVALAKSETPNEKRFLSTLLKSTAKYPDINDIVMSILLDLESRNQQELARERYFNSQPTAPYTQEAFFEFIAYEDELAKEFNESPKYELTEQILTGLVRGTLRHQNYELATDISNFLHESFPSDNATTLTLYCKSCVTLKNYQSTHFLLLPRDVKSDIDAQIAQLTTSIKRSDTRDVATLMNLIKATDFSNLELIELGLKNITNVKKIDLAFSDQLNKLASIDSSKETSFNLPDSTIDLESYAKIDIAISNNKISTYNINKWFNQGGQVQTGEEHFDKFIELRLKTATVSKNSKSRVNDTKKLADDYLKEYGNKLIEIHPITIMKLCEDFLDIGLPLCAVNYLKTILPESPWLSPVYNCYLNALLAAEKYEQLSTQLKSIKYDEKNFSTWLIEALLHKSLKNYDKAVTAAKEAISLYDGDADSWYILLHVMRLNGSSAESLQQVVLNEIPHSIFKEYHWSKVPLINEIATRIDPYIAERILVDWFVKNPEDLAIPLTQIHFNSIFNRAKETNNPYSPNNCGDGVVYFDGYTTRKKVLIKNTDSNHSNFLDVESELGQVLQTMKPGDEADSPLGIIKLVERLPSYVAAFRLALDLRETKNDGTDLFWRLTLPTNEEEFIPAIEKQLKQFKTIEESNNEVLQNPNIPLVMRGNYTDPYAPVKGAVTHLTSESSTKYIGLFDKGIDNPSTVIIDVYTAVYFALTGLGSTLANSTIKTIISEQSKLVIEQWIKQVTREDYMSLDYRDGGLIRYTADDIKRNSATFINELKTLIYSSEIGVLRPSDTPDNLIKIKDIMDHSVYTTFQLSIANEIPWLCVDHHMSILSHKSGYPVANMNSVTLDLVQSASMHNKKRGIALNLYVGTPFPIMHKDILELCNSSNHAEIDLVFQFMKKHGISSKLLTNDEQNLSYLAEMIRFVTQRAFSEGKILNPNRINDPSYDGLAEKVFNICSLSAIKFLPGTTAEERFASLLYKLADHPNIPTKKYILLLSDLASLFASGQFLDTDEINRNIAYMNNQDS